VSGTITRAPEAITKRKPTSVGRLVGRIDYLTSSSLI
jgi:hypothetical protein